MEEVVLVARVATGGRLFPHIGVHIEGRPFHDETVPLDAQVETPGRRPLLEMAAREGGLGRPSRDGRVVGEEEVGPPPRQGPPPLPQEGPVVRVDLAQVVPRRDEEAVEDTGVGLLEKVAAQVVRRLVVRLGVHDHIVAEGGVGLHPVGRPGVVQTPDAVDASPEVHPPARVQGVLRPSKTRRINSSPLLTLASSFTCCTGTRSWRGGFSCSRTSL